MTGAQAALAHDHVSEHVVAALADAVGVEPAALETPLYEVMDPDALDRLYAEPPHPSVEFEYEGLQVSIEPGARVIVDETVYRPSDTRGH